MRLRVPRLFLRIFLSYWAALIATILVVFLAFPRPDNQTIAWALATRLVAAIALSGIACFVVARYIVRPMGTLSTAARALAAGDLSARAVYPTNAADATKDEIEILVRDFNEMAERLERIVESQKRLMRDVSHELRSPLSRLSIALDLLQQPNEDVERHLASMSRDIGRLNLLIERLLTLSRLEAANELAATEWFDLSDLVMEVRNDAMREAQARSCEVQCEIAHEYPVPGDYELLRSALDNIVRNALRYTPTGGTVELGLSFDRDGSPRIAVRDSGPGIPESELVNVFRPFYQVERSRAPANSGFGIGLAIAERAVHLHGGSITAMNRLPQGLTVEIRLPVGPANALDLGVSQPPVNRGSSQRRTKSDGTKRSRG